MIVCLCYINSWVAYKKVNRKTVNISKILFAPMWINYCLFINYELAWYMNLRQHYLLMRNKTLKYLFQTTEFYLSF